MTATAQPSTISRHRRRKSSAPSSKTLEEICPEAVARIEDVRQITVQHWIYRASQLAKAADRKVIPEVGAENVELDELHSFAGIKHPDEQGANLDEVGQHWTHVAMVRESRLMLEVVVGPRTQESATKLVEGVARRLASDCWPLWSSDGWEPYRFAFRALASQDA